MENDNGPPCCACTFTHASNSITVGDWDTTSFWPTLELQATKVHWKMDDFFCGRDEQMDDFVAGQIKMQRA